MATTTVRGDKQVTY